jgi:two-component system, chemotaxis family, response regulator Rcp1
MHNSFTSDAYVLKKMATRQHKKVILVEDNLADVELVKISVRELTMPVELIHVGDGQELLRIGVILLDLNMPRVSGLDVLRHMHKDPALNKIPVVMFTTSNSRTDIMKCYELGAKAFVCKPLDINDFNDSIRSIVEFWTSVNILPMVN